MEMTLAQMLENSVTHFPDRTAIVCEANRMTYRELDERVAIVSGFLSKMGIEKGQRIGLLMHKSPEMIIAFLAAAQTGGIVVPFDFNQPFGQIQHLMKSVAPAALIVSEDLQALFSHIDLPCPNHHVIVTGRKGDPSFHQWQDVILDNGNRAAANRPVSADDTVYFNMTSGTTGFPKCAVTTHANVYWNTVASVESLGLTSEDVHLCMFPSFVHPHEIFARPLYLGGTMVLLDKVSPKSLTDTLVQQRVTCMMAIAPIYGTLTRFHRSTNTVFPDLRLAESGGMRLTAPLAESFKQRFHIPIVHVWGSTETAGVALAMPVDGTGKPGAMGRPCPHYEVNVLDAHGNAQAPGRSGEMVIRGPAVCSGYFENPNETRKHMKDGWYFTDDIVCKDAEGYFHFKSRKSGMIKMAGLKVYPAEIEDVLMSHPLIREVAVIKAVDGIHGEVPKAVIVTADHAKIGKKEIVSFCEGKIPKYKVPRIVAFTDTLPKTPGGKILYKEL